MKTSKQGPSLYYASDKNIYDALNQSKVDNDTVQKLFGRRNVIISKKTPRNDLAKYFSRLTHDFLDHQDIAQRLGVISHRERLTSIDLNEVFSSDQITRAIEKLSESLKSDGDVVHAKKTNEAISVNIQYTEVDYRRSEFNQVQHREGQIELVKQEGGYVLRSTQSEYVDGARDEFIRHLEVEVSKPIERAIVSLYGISNPKVRSKFFYDLMNNLPDYDRGDVTDVYVYKSRIQTSLSIQEDSDGDSHIERIAMRGNGVSQSKILNDLLDDKKYHISRVGWIAKKKLGSGFGFHMEAMFKEPGDCNGFSYLLKGVYELEHGILSKKRRLPTHSEIESMSKVIESAARILMKNIRSQIK